MVFASMWALSYFASTSNDQTCLPSSEHFRKIQLARSEHLEFYLELLGTFSNPPRAFFSDWHLHRFHNAQRFEFNQSLLICHFRCQIRQQ